MKIWITTNGRPSESATLLAEQKNFGRAVLGGTIKPSDVLVNWGSGAPINTLKKPKVTFNKPEAVAIATNKLKAFISFKEADVSTPEWTTDKEVATSWGHTVLARTKLTGHSGEGIVVVAKGEEIPEAPLYTYYIFKDKEYRVHVCDGKVFDTQRKIKDPDKEVLSWKVRSHQNGFIFARNGLDNDNVRDQVARHAVGALGLDFGAVDLIQDSDGKYYVLEINTAPGMEGTTLQSYVDALTGLAGKYENVL